MQHFKTAIKFAIILVSVILTAPTSHTQATSNLETHLLTLCARTPTSNSESDTVSAIVQKNHENACSRILAEFDEAERPQVNLQQQSNTKKDFAAYANNTIEVTINPTYPVPVTVDGILQGPDVTVFELNPGQHTFSVPETVQMKTDSRLKFENWSDGSTSQNRTEYLTDDTTLTPIYVMQYSLTLISPEVNVSGAGWYDSGDSATFSAPVFAPMRGILGLLGAKWTFEGWYEGGTLISSSNQITVSMTKPLRYHALWAEDFTEPAIVLGITVPTALGGTFLYGRTKPKSKFHQSSSLSSSPASSNLKNDHNS